MTKQRKQSQLKRMESSSSEKVRTTEHPKLTETLKSRATALQLAKNATTLTLLSRHYLFICTVQQLKN